MEEPLICVTSNAIVQVASGHIPLPRPDRNPLPINIGYNASLSFSITNDWPVKLPSMLVIISIIGFRVSVFTLGVF